VIFLLDTHVLIWLLEGNERLGQQAKQLADRAFAENALSVSAITFWETAMLQQRQRISLSLPVNQWRQELLAIGLREIAVTGEIGIAATELDNFHADPADRIITATALLENATLITADNLILNWNGQLRRHNARV
jgi:PIN domain nuclease of toxin-antitoxin system